jgi:hypothetical protein
MAYIHPKITLFTGISVLDSQKPAYYSFLSKDKSVSTGRAEGILAYPFGYYKNYVFS